MPFGHSIKYFCWKYTTSWFIYYLLRNYLYFILFHTHPREIHRIQWIKQIFKTRKHDWFVIQLMYSFLDKSLEYLAIHTSFITFALIFRVSCMHVIYQCLGSRVIFEVANLFYIRCKFFRNFAWMIVFVFDSHDTDTGCTAVFSI